MGGRGSKPIGITTKCGDVFSNISKLAYWYYTGSTTKLEIAIKGSCHLAVATIILLSHNEPLPILCGLAKRNLPNIFVLPTLMVNHPYFAKPMQVHMKKHTMILTIMQGFLL